MEKLIAYKIYQYSFMKKYKKYKLSSFFKHKNKQKYKYLLENINEWVYSGMANKKRELR